MELANLPEKIFHHTYDNGLTLLAERMDHVRSVAVNFLVPAGAAFDPDGQLGIASVLAEMITRTFYESQGKSIYNIRETKNIGENGKVVATVLARQENLPSVKAKGVRE